MAWTYFTAPLAAGEELTAEMWYELCEALAERLSVVQGNVLLVDLAAAATIRDSRLAFRRVPTLRGGSFELVAWDYVLSAGAIGSWSENTSTPAALTRSAGGSVTTSTEWTAEGLSSETEWNTLRTAVAAGFDDRRYWNIIRATIQRLKIPRYQIDTSIGTIQAVSVDEPTWADVLIAYAAATPTSSPPSSALNLVRTSAYKLPSRVELGTRRADLPITFPSSTPLAVADAWTFADVYMGPTAEDITLTFAGNVTTTALSAGSALKFPLQTAADIRGAQTLSAELAGWADPSPYEPAGAYDSDGSSWGSVAGIILYIHASPIWTKP